MPVVPLSIGSGTGAGGGWLLQRCAVSFGTPVSPSLPAHHNSSEYHVIRVTHAADSFRIHPALCPSSDHVASGVTGKGSLRHQDHLTSHNRHCASIARTDDIYPG